MVTATAHGTIALLTRLTRLTYRRAIEAGLGMHPKLFSVLTVLRDQGEMTQQALGAALGLDANTVVHMLNGLEEAGHAERRRDPGDRRRHIVAMTPRGAKALAKAELKFDAVEDEVLAELTVEERGTLNELLRRALDG